MMGLIERFCFFRRLSLLRITFALCFVVSFFFISSLLKVTPSIDSPPIFYFAETNKTDETNEIDDFRREWLRQHRARSDWQAIIKPCYDNMAWGKVKAGWGKVNRTNAFTSKIIFQDIRPAEEYSKIFIQSKTSDNRTKVIGGDTWRVHVRGPSSIAATVFDHNNGTYEALFLIMEPGIYQLSIYLDYSLCDGFKDPPRDWFIKGDAQGKYQKEGLLGPLDDYLVKPLQGGRLFEINVARTKMNLKLVGK